MIERSDRLITLTHQVLMGHITMEQRQGLRLQLQELALMEDEEMGSRTG